MRFALPSIAGALLAATAVSASEHQARHPAPRHHALAARDAMPEPAPAPAPEPKEQAQGNSNYTLAKRADFTNARFTYYDVGLGACGQTNVASDYIVALNADQYTSGSYCFDSITITYNGKTTTATIMDECPGCPYGGLDMSEGLFTFFSDESAGVIYGEWSFASGSSSGSSSSSADTWTSTSTWSSSSSVWTPTTTSTWSSSSSTWSSSSSSSTSSSSSSSSSSTSSSSSSLSSSASASVSAVVNVGSNSLVSGSASATGSASGNIEQLYMGIIEMGAVIAAGPTASASA